MLLPATMNAVPCRLGIPLYAKGNHIVRVFNECNLRVKQQSASSLASNQDCAKCYVVLQVPADSSFETVRNAFLALAKRYHPDGGSPDANAEKFQEVKAAYQTLQLKYSCEANSSKMKSKSPPEAVECDIQHTAPQHRQYLSFDGFGVGSPSHREKQHQKMRAVQASDNVISHRIRKINLDSSSHSPEEALAIKDKAEARKIKTRFGMDRLVEDLIQESMAKGDFDNLSGSGKPLKRDNFNPYVDFTTHKLNEVLIENGFMPEWITLQKEIREDRECLRSSLFEKRGNLGPLPLSAVEERKWHDEVDKLKPLVQQINGKINKYNLLVPIIHKQMLLVQLDKEANKVLETGEAHKTPPGKGLPLRTTYHSHFGENDSLFGAILAIFSGNSK